jgi:hypothetical protein
MRVTHRRTTITEGCIGGYVHRPRCRFAPDGRPASWPDKPSVPGPPRPLAGTGGYPHGGLFVPCPFLEQKAPRRLERKERARPASARPQETATTHSRANYPRQPETLNLSRREPQPDVGTTATRSYPQLRSDRLRALVIQAAATRLLGEREASASPRWEDSHIARVADNASAPAGDQRGHGFRRLAGQKSSGTSSGRYHATSGS